jgi:hypothetical protein
MIQQLGHARCTQDMGGRGDGAGTDGVEQGTETDRPARVTDSIRDFLVGECMERTTKSSRASGHFHAVRFYQDDESLCRIVADFLSDGLATGQPALVVATPEQRAGIMEELRARGVEIADILAAGDLLLLDARETLSSVMVDGRPDTARFTSSMTAAIDRVCRGRMDCHIHVYGQMVDLLWKDGLTVAAIRLEILWNQLAMTHDFSLVCGYAMGNFYKDAQVEDICRHHSHAFCPDGAAAPVDLERITIN